MRRMRLVALILALCMLAATMLGCSGSGAREAEESKTAGNTTAGESAKATEGVSKAGFPIVPEKMTVKAAIFGAPNFVLEENRFFKRMEELTNIHFDMEVIPASTYTEKKNLLLASGEYPEVFIKANFTKADEMLYGSQGILLSLEKLIDDYAPNLTAVMSSNPDVRRTITTPEGHIYSFPTVKRKAAASLLFVNNVWLQNLSLKNPTNPEEFYTILKAFKENDPNKNGKKDEIPLSLTGVNKIKFMANNWGLLMGVNDVFVSDGKVLHGPTQAQFKEALTYFRKLYAEGLLDKETFTQNGQQLQAKGQAQDQQLGVILDLAPFSVVGAERDTDFVPVNPFPYNGEQIILGNTGVNAGTFVITNKCKNPEVLVRWADYLYSEEGGIQARMGKEGEEYKMNSDGTWNWILAEGQSQNDVRKYLFQGGANIPELLPQLWSKLNDPQEKRVLENSMTQDSFMRTAYPDVYFSEDTQKRLAVLATDIGAYVNQFIVQAVTGDINVESEWENYLATLKKMGLEEMVKIHQDGYDQYIKN